MPRLVFQKLIHSALNQKTLTPPLDGELLYCKNNVCVHPPGLLSNSVLHHPGFLAVTAHVKNGIVSIIFNWTPSLKLNNLESCNNEEAASYKDLPPAEGNTATSSECADLIVSNIEGGLSVKATHGNTMYDKEQDSEQSAFKIPVASLNDDEEEQVLKSTEDIMIDVASVNSTTNNETPDICINQSSSPHAVHNFQFPENSICFRMNDVEYQGRVVRPLRHETFGPFTVNLALMRSIRIYFRNDACSCGELVIATHESQYKVLHFHYGGLNSIAAILNDWKVMLDKRFKTSNDIGINHFSIIHPNLTSEQLHPEEGLYRNLTADAWSLFVDEFGRIQNQQKIQKAVFFGGVEKELRPAVWPFLLKFYNFDSTGIERNEIQQKKLVKYQRINRDRETIFASDVANEFWRNVACSVEKDVLRTDRANPFFKGEGNPNLDTLQRILLNYAVYTATSYTQGMSDLLSPLLIEIQEESNVFWCFVGLMQRTIFISSPSDNEMEKQLFYLRELLRILLPDFYAHLLSCGPGAEEMLFAHRWILLCFKREFAESEALVIWEACWAHYQTNYFHLFVCVAIIALYGIDVAENRLASDEMLLHFSHLALQMNSDLVLKKARGLLHQLRTSSSVPCTLHDLFYMTSFDGTPHQLINLVCVKSERCEDGCPHNGKGEERIGFTFRKLFPRSSN